MSEQEKYVERDTGICREMRLWRIEVSQQRQNEFSCAANSKTSSAKSMPPENSSRTINANLGAVRHACAIWWIRRVESVPGDHSSIIPILVDHETNVKTHEQHGMNEERCPVLQTNQCRRARAGGKPCPFFGLVYISRADQVCTRHRTRTNGMIES